MSESKHPGTDGTPPPEPAPARLPPRPPQADARLKLQLLVGLLAALVLFHFVSGPVGAFVVGGGLILTGFCLMASNRVGMGMGMGVLLAGLAIASIGVALRVTSVPVPPNPTTQNPTVYYGGWLQVEEQRCRGLLARGQQVKLAFEPGTGNVLRVETTGVPPEKQRGLAERIEQDFKSSYPGVVFQVRLSAGRAVPVQGVR